MKWAEGDVSINDGIAQSCLLGLARGRIHSFPTSDLPGLCSQAPPRLRYPPSACFTNSENGKDGQSNREVVSSVEAMVDTKTRAKGLKRWALAQRNLKSQQRRWLTLAYTPTVPDFLNIGSVIVWT
jgi:hypothetical protein